MVLALTVGGYHEGDDIPLWVFFLSAAVFLHVTEHRATAGCVAVSHAHLITIMRWLNPHRDPVISIGVGRDATRILHAG